MVQLSVGYPAFQIWNKAFFISQGILSVFLACLQSEKCPLIASSSLMSSSVSGLKLCLFSLLMISDVPLIQEEGGDMN